MTSSVGGEPHPTQTPSQPPSLARSDLLLRVIARIERHQPLPEFDGRFDVITAYMICFNDHKTDHIRGPAEWDFFLNDAARHLAPGGRIHLELNEEFDGTCYTPESRAYFLRRGAVVVNNRITFTPDSRAQP